ncbi:uncharacterized protein LOC108033026 isoform X2 [Drosophila biarmipes]|uniref:uncharacterized protein LOC108033026 isoform X2 n=1 Tax=Drosophila biarmipes TaxID=125945 RepID=UPI0021CCEEB4|nr:uncharacterized protein LOC108033026 isoform X2 [Drosophila biarmipes]
MGNKDTNVQNPEKCTCTCSPCLKSPHKESNPKDVKQNSSGRKHSESIPELRLPELENQEEGRECQLCNSLSRRGPSDLRNRTNPPPTPHNYCSHEDLKYYEGAKAPWTATNKPPAPTAHLQTHKDLDMKPKSSRKSHCDLIPELQLRDLENDEDEGIECQICKTQSRRLSSEARNWTPPAPTPHNFYRHEDLKYYEGARSPRTPTNKPPVPTPRYPYKQGESVKSSRTLTNKPPVPTPHNKVIEGSARQKRREDFKDRGKPSSTGSNLRLGLRSAEELKATVLSQIEEQEALEKMKLKTEAKKAKSRPLGLPSGGKAVRKTTDCGPQENKNRTYEAKKPESKPLGLPPGEKAACKTTDRKPQEIKNRIAEPKKTKSKPLQLPSAGKNVLDPKEDNIHTSEAKKAESKPLGLPTGEKTARKRADQQEIKKHTSEKTMLKASPGTMNFHLSADDIARTTIFNPLTRHIQHLYLNVRERALAIMEDLHKMPRQIDEIHRNAAAERQK